MRTGLTKLGLETVSGPSAITPIILGATAKAMAASQRLLELGVFVIGFGYPVYYHPPYPYGGYGYHAAYNPYTGAYSHGMSAYGPYGGRSVGASWDAAAASARRCR